MARHLGLAQKVRLAIAGRHGEDSDGHRDKPYREWILTQPCLICRRKRLKQASKTEGHHFGGRGLGSKVSDLRLLPLCGAAHHREGPEAVHKLGKRFAAHHGIDVGREIERLNTEWRKRNPA